MEALKAAGITPGPLYKKIKSGENIELENGKIVIFKLFHLIEIIY